MRYTREQACLAWLAQGMLGSRRLKKLLDEYGSAEAAYDAFQRDHGASLQNPGFRITACRCCGQARRGRNCMICS